MAELSDRLKTLYTTLNTQRQAVLADPDNIDSDAVAQAVVAAQMIALGVDTSDATGQMLGAGVYAGIRQKVKETLDKYKANPDQRLLLADNVNSAFREPLQVYTQATAVQAQFAADESVPASVPFETMVRKMLGMDDIEA